MTRLSYLKDYSGSSGSFGVPAEKDPRHPSPGIETLDAFALERWEVRHVYELPFLVLNCTDNTALYGLLGVRTKSDASFPRRAFSPPAKRPHVQCPVSIGVPATSDQTDDLGNF